MVQLCLFGPNCQGLHSRRWKNIMRGRTWVPGWWHGAKQAAHLLRPLTCLRTVPQQTVLYDQSHYWSFEYLCWICVNLYPDLCGCQGKSNLVKCTGSLTLAKNLISWSWGDFSFFPLLTMASTKTKVTQSWPEQRKQKQSQHFRDREAFHHEKAIWFLQNI